MTKPKVKITIMIDPDVLARVESEVPTGRLRSISAYIEHAVTNQLMAEEDFDSMLAEMLDETGGPPTDAERAAARHILDGTGP